MCSKYLETFTQVKERENDFVDLSVDLLAGMRDLIKTDPRVCIFSSASSTPAVAPYLSLLFPLIFSLLLFRPFSITKPYSVRGSVSYTLCLS